MARPRAPSPAVVVLALIAAGALQFAATVEVVSDETARIGLAAVAVTVVLYLMVTVDPAWLLSGGLVATMFAGHWEDVGIDTPVPPHRALIVAGLVALMLRTNGRDRPRLRLGAVHFVLAAAVAYAVISAIFAETIERSSAQFILLDDFGVMPFLLFLVAPVAFRTERQRLILLGSLVAAGAYLAVVALLEKLKLYDLVLPSYIGDPLVGTHFGRSRGPFAEAAANGLAIYACAIAAAVAFFVWRSRAQRAVAAAVAILAPVGLLLTVTRSVWLAGIAGTLFALVTTPELRRFAVPVAAAGAAAVLIAFATIPGLAAQASERRQDKNPVYERENTSAAGLRMLADRPILGFGWASSDEHIEPYFRQDPNIPLVGINAGIHNLYLEYGIDLGLVGLGIWLLGGVLALHAAFSGRAPPAIRPWQIGLKAIVVAWAVVGLASPTKYSFITTVMWTWAGVACVRAQPVGGATTSSLSQGKPRSTSSG
jgi:O-antigen ligase